MPVFIQIYTARSLTHTKKMVREEQGNCRWAERKAFHVHLIRQFLSSNYVKAALLKQKKICNEKCKRNVWNIKYTSEQSLRNTRVGKRSQTPKKGTHHVIL